MALEHFANAPIPSSPSTPWTTLSAGVDAVTTTLPIVAFAAFPSAVQFRILVNDEWMLVTAGAGTTSYTVTRGIEGSTAAVHASGAGVFHVLTAGGLARHPRSMTTAGDTEYLDSAGAPMRLASPSDGDYLTRWTSAVPSWVTPATAGLLTAAAAAATYQPLDADLIAIAALSGTGGWAKRTGSDTWSITIPTASDVGAVPSASGSASIGYVVPVVGTIDINLLPAGSQGSVHIGPSNSFVLTDTFLGGGTALLITGDNAPLYAGISIVGVNTASPYIEAAAASGSHTAPSAVSAERVLGGYSFDGYCTTHFRNAARINVIADGNFTDSSSPGRFEFSTTPAGSTINVLRLTIGSDGAIVATGALTAAALHAASMTIGGVAVATQTYVNAQGFLTSVTAHNVLSTTHGDTLAASVVRGSLIIGNATPKWSALAVGAAATILSSDGTDATWVAATGTGSPVRATSPVLVTPTLGVATGTRLGLGVAAAAVTPLVVRGTGATSATTAMVIEDSAGVDYFATRNDGQIAVGKVAVDTANTAYSALAFGADFGTVVTYTNTTNGNSTPVNLFYGDLRLAGTQEYTRAYAGEFIVRCNNTHASNAVGGANFSAEFGAAGGRAASLTGGKFQAKTGDATGGTVTTLIGISGFIQVNHASVIATSAYGLRILDLGNTGTITNTYGIYVGDMTTGTQPSQAYNIYLSDVNARNLLSGNTEIVGNLTLSAKNLITDTTTGMKIGTATTQPIGFYNATPIVQGASIADASGGAIIDDEARAAINALISRIEATGLIATV